MTEGITGGESEALARAKKCSASPDPELVSGDSG